LVIINLVLDFPPPFTYHIMQRRFSLCKGKHLFKVKLVNVIYIKNGVIENEIKN